MELEIAVGVEYICWGLWCLPKGSSEISETWQLAALAEKSPIFSSVVAGAFFMYTVVVVVCF